jgi:predicted nuclease of restriction endonuclease-like (RecB) superfamily
MPRKTKQVIPAIKALETDKDYQNLLDELKSIIAQGQYQAYKAVDNIKVQTYWQIGERIVREELKHKDRADYGKYLIENLSVDLGTPKRRLYEIVKFYRVYPIVRSVTAQLSWTHYVALTDIENKEKRAFYENQAVIHSWSVRELKKQLRAKLYENTPKKEIQAVFQTKLPSIRPQEVFKDTYDFQFIELHSGQNEKDLENKILDNFEKFLHELGEDFSILGRQVPLKIDGETHFIDLVLYHRGIPCIVLVDLKIGKLDSRDIGQMNKYIGYYRRYKQYAHEQDTIGLIICREAGREEVVYALDGLEEKIFIAKYKVKLPSEAKIKKAIKNL